MKTLSFIFSLILCFTALLLNSCNQEDEIIPFPEKHETPVIMPVTEFNAYIQSVISEGHPVYALALEARCTNGKEIEKVVVDGRNEQHELLKDDKYGYVFKKFGNYEPTPPENGTYSFKIIFTDGQEVSGSKTITSPFLLPSQNAIATLLYDNNNDVSVLLNWNAVSSTDYYVVNSTFFSDENPQGRKETSKRIYLGSRETGEMQFPIYYFMAPPMSYQFEVLAVDLNDGTSNIINSISLTKAEISIESY